MGLGFRLCSGAVRLGINRLAAVSFGLAAARGNLFQAQFLALFFLGSQHFDLFHFEINNRWCFEGYITQSASAQFIDKDC